MSELRWSTHAQLHHAYRAGELSPVEVCDDALNVVEEHDDAVNAFVSVHAEEARAAARASQERWRAGQPLGPADGIPTSVKDIFLTRGHPTLRGSSLVTMAGSWNQDAPAVERLREGGAVLIGRTTLPEFAWKGTTDSIRHGVTTNPWDPATTAGGSSGGSAAAVALGMGTWSIGTDGGGSVRIPAAFTGTVALKPTQGRIPLWPPSPYGTLAHAGPMTRTVRDTATLLDLIAVPDPRDWTHLPAAGSSTADLERGIEGVRVAYCPAWGWPDAVAVDPEVAHAVEQAMQVLVDGGARVEQVDPPLGNLEELQQAFEVLWFTGAGKVLRTFGEGALDRVDPALAEQVQRYAECSAQDYLDATAVRMELGEAMGTWHESYDVVVGPTMPTVAFPARQSAPTAWPSPLWTSWTPFTYPFNMTGQPALSLPCGFTTAGLPVGLQVVGARHTDAAVLQVGQAYEQATEWHARHPPAIPAHEGDRP
ncbi:MAG: amidase [Ornithinimicrobium sp.]